MFLNDSQPINHVNMSSNAFINEYMRTVAKYGELWYKYGDTHNIFQVRDYLSIVLGAAMEVLPEI